jgi:hypothetical protein
MGNRQKQQQAQTQHPDVATQLFNAQQQQALTTNYNDIYKVKPVLRGHL